MNVTIAEPLSTSALHQQFETLFTQCFASTFLTELCGGADEPLYLPISDTRPLAQIWYREDFPASALHEIAHWCIAGPQRRLLEDYGYWYEPDGRSAIKQQAFEQVEVKPQALEAAFSHAARFPFRISADNLEGDLGASAVFEQRVWQCAIDMVQTDQFPPRARQWLDALEAHFGPVDWSAWVESIQARGHAC